jgi:sugar lactone lactonase YvrE
MINVFSNVECELGEGPLWHPLRQSLFWLDINNKMLYEKAFSSTKLDYDNSWLLPDIGSALALDGNNIDSLLIITDQCFSHLDLNKGTLIPITKLALAENMRTNDGGVAPDGSFWFGSMEKKPTGTKGSIFSIQPNGELRGFPFKIGIPNTFCWAEDGKILYLSDSLQQKMFTVKVDSELDVANSVTDIFVDLSSTTSTPDGGAIDIEGNLWNAQWDGFKVQCYSNKAKELTNIQLPVPKVTSCCFGGPEMKYLFITTAKEGMTADETSIYPLSGSTFAIPLTVVGTTVPAFFMDDILIPPQEIN